VQAVAGFLRAMRIKGWGDDVARRHLMRQGWSGEVIEAARKVAFGQTEAALDSTT
jgi:hypothetical protein